MPQECLGAVKLEGKVGRRPQTTQSLECWAAELGRCPVRDGGQWGMVEERPVLPPLSFPPESDIHTLFRMCQVTTLPPHSTSGWGLRLVSRWHCFLPSTRMCPDVSAPHHQGPQSLPPPRTPPLPSPSLTRPLFPPCSCSGQPSPSPSSSRSSGRPPAPLQHHPTLSRSLSILGALSPRPDSSSWPWWLPARPCHQAALPGRPAGASPGCLTPQMPTHTRAHRKCLKRGRAW